MSGKKQNKRLAGVKQESLRPVTRRRRPAQERSRTTVSSILDATETLIEQEGIDRITTNKIAEKVGVSVGTLYSYFPNKESVLFSLAQRWLEMNNQAVAQGLPDKKPDSNWMDWLDQLFNDVFEVYLKEPGMTQYYDTLRFIPELRELDDQHERKMIKTMTSALTTLGHNGSDRERRIDSLMLLLTIHTFMTRAVIAEPADRSAILRQLRLLIHSMLLPRFV